MAIDFYFFLRPPEHDPNSLPWEEATTWTTLVRIIDDEDRAELRRLLDEHEAKQAADQAEKKRRDREDAAKAQANKRCQELHQNAAELRKVMGCNCDLDNWEPEVNTGHSWVCRIHKVAIGQMSFDEAKRDSDCWHQRNAAY